MHPVVQAIVVWESDVKRIELWNKASWEVTISIVGVIVSSKIFLPFLIPRGLMVRSRIIYSGFFTHPENGSRNILFPRVSGLLIFFWIRRCRHDGYPRATLCREHGGQQTEHKSECVRSQRTDYKWIFEFFPMTSMLAAARPAGEITGVLKYALFLLSRIPS